MTRVKIKPNNQRPRITNQSKIYKAGIPRRTEMCLLEHKNELFLPSVTLYKTKTHGYGKYWLWMILLRLKRPKPTWHNTPVNFHIWRHILKGVIYSTFLNKSKILKLIIFVQTNNFFIGDFKSNRNIFSETYSWKFTSYTLHKIINWYMSTTALTF